MLVLNSQVWHPYIHPWSQTLFVSLSHVLTLPQYGISHPTLHSSLHIVQKLYDILGMQNTALSFTERSSHFGATSSDHESYHQLAASEGDKVILYTVWREKEWRSNSTSVDVNLLMSFCWCHSVDVHWDKLISLYWYHSKNFTLWTSLCWCLFIDVTLLMTILWRHSINNKICE